MNTADAKDMINYLLDKFGLFKEVGSQYDDVARKLFQIKISWTETSDPEFPYEASLDNAHWKLRVNDFPEEEMYTLMINNRAIISFTEKPDAWFFPKPTATLS